MTSFTTEFRRECIEASAIAPELFDAAIEVTPDIVIGADGAVQNRLTQALNWKQQFKRSGKTSCAPRYVALLNSEDGSTWQAKLETPIFDKKKQKARKYETPLGNGSRAYLPPIPNEIRDRIAARYKVNVPHDGSFWTWVESKPDLPIIWTEGGKKALSLLSQGYVAISLYGVNGGYRRDSIKKTRSLTPDVDRFCQVGRQHILAFDQDDKPSTRIKVGKALIRFGDLLSATGIVSVMTWSGGAKGIDDFIVSAGPGALEIAYQNAIALCDWRFEQELFRPLQTPVALAVNVPDLSTLTIEQIPDEGIVAFISAKGTGKTNVLQSLVADRKKVLSATFRIALGRNLASRIGVDWRGDLDKVEGQFINGAGYSLRVGFCIEALLAINPETFAGCDLIIDECSQVVRQILTSSTCQTGGMRPALLARFHELLQVARRVLIADADLSDIVINYIKTLRGDDKAPFLIFNDYQPPGYPVIFLEAPDRSAITQKLLTAVGELPAGKTIFVATDSKATSQAIAQILDRTYPNKRVLVINSETSGGGSEREFMKAPDAALNQGSWDVIVSSPSMATGISIEVQGVIDEVFGIFTGSSGTDSDLSQALSRVREPVPRTVWCAKKGNNFCKVSPSSNVTEIKKQLRNSTAATVRLIRANLREDTVETLDRFNWDTDPHLHLYCALSADQNASMYNLREALYLRLKREGNIVTVQQAESIESVKTILTQTRREQREQAVAAIANARDLSYTEVKALQTQVGESLNSEAGISAEDQQAIDKFRVKDFYRLDAVTPEDITWDQDGKRRLELTALEVQLEPSLASDRTIKSLEHQMTWKKGICPWDLNLLELRRSLREELGLNEFIQAGIQNDEWTSDDLRVRAIAKKARALSQKIRVVLRFTIHPKMSDLQLVHELLQQLGLKMAFRWSRAFPGQEGKKIRIYSLDRDHWAKVQGVLERRREWRKAGSPLCEESINNTGDPDVDDAPEPECELLEDALEYGEEVIAILWQGMQRSVQASILPKLPPAIAQIVRNVEAYPLLHQEAG